MDSTRLDARRRSRQFRGLAAFGMNGERFDDVTRSFWDRRDLLRVAAGGALVGMLGLLRLDEKAGAEKKGKKGKKGKKTKKKDKKVDCSTCPADYPICCQNNDPKLGPPCCPTVLPICCPFGCCPTVDNVWSCGYSATLPCLFTPP